MSLCQKALSFSVDDFRDGALFRILVMEKRAAWADASEAGSWLFREFAAYEGRDALPVLPRVRGRERLRVHV
ncbi:MAG: hypothetical protein RIC85_05950 [Gammaproteobacteria bacterium]